MQTSRNSVKAKFGNHVLNCCNVRLVEGVIVCIIIPEKIIELKYDFVIQTIFINFG